MSDITNLSDTIVPKSDQLNAEQLLAGPITITVTRVTRSDTPDQPVAIGYQDDAGRPYKPCKTMRKVLIFAWGENGADWIGRSMTLYCDPNVKFGGVKVGGVRISHLSHIERDIAISLTATKGKKEPVTIKRLAAQQPARPQPPAADHTAALKSAATQGMASLQAAWGNIPAAERRAIDPKGCPAELKQIAQEADDARFAAAAAPADEPPADDGAPADDGSFF